MSNVNDHIDKDKDASVSVYYFIKKLEITAFLIMSVSFSLLFGILDLYLENIFFLKFQSVITSLFLAAFFGLTLIGDRKPIILEFAQRQGRIAEDDISVDTLFYFRFLTMLWVGYFLFKAIVYTLVGLQLSLEERILFRTIFGNITFYGLLFGTIFGAQPIWNGLRYLKLLPSSKLESFAT